MAFQPDSSLPPADLIALDGQTPMPKLGFGTFRMENDDVVRMVPRVLEQGYRHIDTAQAYDNEAAVGHGVALAALPRRDIYITSKVWVDNYGYDSFLKSVDDSLSRLQMDYVDLLLLHWPNTAVPLSEQIAALNQVQASGKTRNIGVSNFSTALVEQAIGLSKTQLATNQVEYHPYIDQRKLLRQASDRKMSITAYYAMADGAVLSDPAIGALAAELGRSPAQVVLRWLVQQDGVATLSKTLSPDRAAANLAIFDFALSAAQMNRINGLARPDGRIVSPPELAPEWDAP